jgi:uncharacterized protein (TIGR03083 family)
MSDKRGALEELETEYRKLQEALSGLNNQQLDEPFYDGWSVKDIVAHMLGWEREMTAALQRIAEGERPVPEGVDYSNSDDWNAKFSAIMKNQLPSTVLAEWGQVHGSFVRAARSVPDERFGIADDGRPKTVNRLLETTGYGHYREHLPAILEWRKRQGL